MILIYPSCFIHSFVFVIFSLLFSFVHYLPRQYFIQYKAYIEIMTTPTTAKLVGRALTQARKLVESDTEVSTIDLNLLRNLNTNQSLNYIKLESQLTSLEKDAEQREALTQELHSLEDELTLIEKSVASLGELVEELDQWSREVARERETQALN
ncbi:putative DNA-directed RNA polymerase I subunit [Clavispora lusitaniae]|uniref:DNA-directed RNA polymerase I subunit n=1 Tax=Clavispora lusitaniae TaxID=36911 RepID=A0ACD0WP12_CLALS|nr:putative DNA-directed RNA polymerase I subunit [Clavispora lusitaniae]QFZ34880.1 putative DNA-directed RNA polymerase I subunit [Clavispora lusitaniae]QFZ40565.1 putative DNA-directed RNA polymerase I subunit [Clavispora lusitaniae]QFZ46245.1 putative DNA-directed RNA polymerase I subunit [Clavispora lusitaniae]QFZ51907.1 putative DNA-directed RNA polymerase I subunit [Clavispora lusitaniae]